MPRERTCSRWILIVASMFSAPWVRADEPEARRSVRPGTTGRRAR